MTGLTLKLTHSEAMMLYLLAKSANSEKALEESCSIAKSDLRRELKKLAKQ